MDSGEFCAGDVVSLDKMSRGWDSKIDRKGKENKVMRGWAYVRNEWWRNQEIAR